MISYEMHVYNLYHPYPSPLGETEPKVRVKSQVVNKGSRVNYFI